MSQQPLKTAIPQTTQAEIPTDLLLSLATGPLLLGVLSIQALGSWLHTAGMASEEVFRGDRLPILPFPDLPSSDMSD
ncbi:MAG TPA: hypothetical protein DDZ80_16225 [Cyanobacteria bacterium UBA8803]|nr:hypothetical protein [Cyanobacteria bacterium UBA8803]